MFTCYCPSSCPPHASLWEDKQWGWGEWLGQLGNHPHPSLARLCPAHKGQSESCSSPVAEGLEGGKGEAQTGVAAMGFSITHILREV